MRKALISTLGFDEKFCYRAILRHGLKEGDKIILITAKMVDRVKETYEWIKKFIEKSYSESIDVELMEIDVNSFEDSIRKIVEKLRELEGHSIVLNLSGGMRSLIAVVLLSLIINPMRNIKVEMELEDMSGIVEIPLPLLRIREIGAKLIEERIEILRKIKEGYKDIKSLAEVMKKDKSTIRRHIYVLDELGLINVVKKKPMKIEISSPGEIFVYIKEKAP